MNRRTLLVGGVAALVATAATASLLIPRDLEASEVYAPNGVALGGTDTVAYFTDGRPIAGDPAFTHEWREAVWHFTSAENPRDLFAADPGAYAPRYGGFCAWAVAAKGMLYTTQPENWAIVGGRLYLNFDDDVQETWDMNRAGFIEEADRRWPEILAAA